MEKDEFIVLAEKISTGTASDQEISLYNAYYNYFQEEKDWDTVSMGDKKQLEAELKVRIEKHILVSGNNKSGFLHLKWLAAAAVLLLVCSSGYLFLKYKAPVPFTLAAKSANEIKPGGNRAVLTLADGSEIVLNNTKNGILAHQGNISVRKLNDGQLVYQNSDKENNPSALPNQSEVFNSITTPRGGQFQIDLPDGTKVWLNSASSLRYPAAFKGKERVVMLSGEAYFEVAHLHIHAKNKIDALPFKVILNNREEVRVLGTHFNVMAYPDDDKSKTTLLQGAVQIVKGNESRIIVPGQQAEVGTGIKVSDADTEEAVAWKNGQILFKDEDLGTIMKQISRWYDVDIAYSGDVPRRLFNGGISRKSNLSSLLKILELNRIHFNIHEKTITVIP